MTRLPVILLGLVETLFVVFLHAPMAMIVLFSFNDSNVVAFPLSGFTLEWYRSLPEKGPMFEALFATRRLGIPVTIATTLVGFLAALALTRHRLPGKKALSGLLMVPLAVPTFILGVALLTLVRQVLDIQPSLWVLGLAHMLIALPYAIFTLSARLQGLDASFEEASRDLGRSPAQTFWRITVPLAGGHVPECFRKQRADPVGAGRHTAAHRAMVRYTPAFGPGHMHPEAQDDLRARARAVVLDAGQQEETHKAC